jgi:hypothetical protein
VARSAVVIGAALVVIGGGALGYALTRKAQGGMTPEINAAMAKAVSELDGDIKAARASVEQRAKTLAEVDRVRNAVSTDAATAMDMVGKEITFKPEAGEVIELGQTPKGGAPASLLVLPADGMRSSRSGVVGRYAELANDKLLITQTVEVVPTEGADKLAGFVTVTHLLELEPAIDRLTGAGVTGTFEINGKTRAVGAPIADATTETTPLPSEASARFVFAVPPMRGGMPVPVLAGGAAAAGIGLMLLLIGMMAGKGKSQPKPQALAPQQDRAAFAHAQTQLSGHQAVAAGTPSPVDLQSGLTINPNTIGPGTMIGRWEVVRRLGSGGMADVYLCHARGEAGFEKLVALKVMHGHLARNQRAVDHFLDEARLAARIHHPNVVAIQDLGKIGNDYAIVMEYVDGVDLERLLASARLAGRLVPLDVGLGILCRICDGLNAAHTATATDGTPLGMIHRDVKSANVLVSKQGGIKVVDFGIAKAASQAHLTIAGETKGTPSMMAPEQRVGEQVDVRADVYSLAAVGFEVLTGHGVNLDLAALAHLGVENWPHLPLPSSLRANLPPELDEILLTAMAFDRERRPANCAVFEATFEAVMKRHNLTASDKDIARWVETELRDVQPVPQPGESISKPAGIA